MPSISTELIVSAFDIHESKDQSKEHHSAQSGNSKLAPFTDVCQVCTRGHRSEISPTGALSMLAQAVTHACQSCLPYFTSDLLRVWDPPDKI